MKQIVLKYGLISGAILAILMAGGFYLYSNEIVDMSSGELIGYASMVLAFLLVFFGIRSYRDDVEQGSITFGRAFKVGILITLVTCGIYVVAWEIIYFGFASNFTEIYSAHVLDGMRADGATEQAIIEMKAEIERFAELYQNPLINSAITFMEVFPVGLVMTLISAAILRRSDRETVVAQELRT